MAMKIRVTAVVAVILIIIGALVALDVESKKEIDVVKGAEMEECTATTATIEWKKTANADGYKLYILNENGEYELYMNIEDGEKRELVLEELSSASVYTFKMSAYRYFRDKEYESEISEESFEVYTLPATPDAVASSDESYTLSVNWTALENIGGYELEYSLNEDMSDATSVELTENTFSLDALTPKTAYYTRVRAYFIHNDENVYSEWSEISSVEIKDKVVMSTDVDPKKPMIALTFDDGPAYDYEGANSTYTILETLEEYNARATFFMVGSRIEDGNAYVLEKEKELGCEFGNHTFSHKYYGNDVPASEISDCSDAVYKRTGQYPTMFRCPGGILTDTIVNECVKEKMPLAYWSVDTKDWELKDADKVYKNIVDNVYDGCIVLMHDIYPTTAEAVQKAVPKLVEDGYQIVTVSELIYYKGGAAAEPGVQYVDYKTTNNDT